MINIIKIVCIYFIYIACLFSQGLVDKIITIVGSHPILHSEILQQAQMVAMSRGLDPSTNPLLFETIYNETLNNIINQMIVLEVAEKDTNIVVVDGDVEKALNQRIESFIQQAGSREEFEKMVGMSMRKVRSEYWDEIRNMLFIEQYKFSLLQNINISRSEVEQFYVSYKDSLPIIPEHYNYAVIEIPHLFGDKSKKGAYVFLDSLKNLIINNTHSFDLIAKKYSEDPGSKNNGGRLGFTERGSLVLEYEEVAYSLKIGEISTPTMSQFGYHLIKLIDRRGEKISSQHILKRLIISLDDKLNTKNIINSIKILTHNDPFVFDSISIDFQNKYNNLSGVYNNIGIQEIPPILFTNLDTLKAHAMSGIIETKKGYCLLYLYKHKTKLTPTLKNSWNLIYKYALQEKQGEIFNKHINELKTKIYIHKNQ